MKVFISWSGKRSRLVAELLHNWIQCVIQAVEPWVSSHDIDRGAVWFSQISNELGASTQGIICLTRDNKDKPWILFEAGALAKGLTSSRVYTLLVDLKPEDIKDPLAQFNHTMPTKDDVFKLILSVNRGLDGRPISDTILRQVFEANWPQFDERFKTILSETESEAAPEIIREPSDMLSEILEAVRGLDRRVRVVETNSISGTNRLSAIPVDKLDDRLKRSVARTSAMFEVAKNEENRILYLGVVSALVTAGKSDSTIIELLTNQPPYLSVEDVSEILRQARSQNSNS
jgi:hypothetical protein